jgi:tetratricopeptide (TPR) repeat protein
MKFNTLLLLLFFTGAFAQNKADAEKLVGEGIDLYDKGDYTSAMSKYDNALVLDKDNLLALSEKTMTLNSLNKYEEGIILCKLAIAKHPKEDLKNIYVNYANALDHSNKTDEAVKIYDEGIALFPNYYQLHFNKGICLSRVGKNDAALTCFQNSFLINPNHGSSLNAIGILETNNNRIPAILAFSRFLIVEPQTARSKANFESLQKLIMKGVTQTDKKAVTISINEAVLPDSTGNSKTKENNFSSADLILSMAASLDFDEKNENKTDVEKFIIKFETLCASLDETQKGNFGFYWENFAPYFIEMNKNKLIEPFAYIAFANTNTEKVMKWHKDNKAEVEKFYNWSKKYNWKKQ